MNSLQDLFLEALRDIHTSEKLQIKALEEMRDAAHSPRLREAFGKHLELTGGHISSLDEVGLKLGCSLEGGMCHTMEGLLKDLKERMKKCNNTKVGDVALIFYAQQIEHHEIANYGSLVEWAQHMGNGYEEVAAILEEILDHEEEADDLLTEIAESEVNPDALGTRRIYA